MDQFTASGLVPSQKCVLPSKKAYDASFQSDIDMICSVITKPEDVRAFHSDSPKHKKCESSNAGWLFAQLLGDCLGFLNGERWERLRSQVEPPFSHKVSMIRLPDTREEARLHLDQLSKYNQNTISEKTLSLHATSAFMKFPFFHTAATIYGTLTEQNKDDLWSIGQTRIALLRHVITGGIHRFEASKWLSKEAFRDLEVFRVEWYGFNEKMYKDRQSYTPAPPIVDLWKSVLDGEMKSTEVIHLGKPPAQ